MLSLLVFPAAVLRGLLRAIVLVLLVLALAFAFAFVGLVGPAFLGSVIGLAALPAHMLVLAACAVWASSLLEPVADLLLHPSCPRSISLWGFNPR